MRLSTEGGPSPETFAHLVQWTQGLCEYDPGNLEPYETDRSYTGDLPLGQNVNDALPTAETGLARGEHEAQLAAAWSTAWAASNGEVQQIISANGADPSRTNLLIVGPAYRAGDTPYPEYLALGFSITWGKPGRNDGLRTEVRGKPRVAVGLQATIGFTTQLDEPQSGRGESCTWLCDKDLPYDLDNRDLTYIAQGDLEAVSDPDRVQALMAIGHAAGRIALAAKDPLKAALPTVSRNALADPASAAAINWRRSSRSNPETKGHVEVCRIDVDPAIFGEDRWAAFVRKSDGGEEEILCYTEDEWRAMISGAKLGEFNIQ